MKQGIKAFIGCLLLVVLDQFTKVLALQNLKGQEPITIIPDVFQLLYVENRGAAFGILQNKQWVFLIITAIVLAALIWALPRMSRERHFLPLRLCLCFIGAGAVGNMIDRIFRGYVGTRFTAPEKGDAEKRKAAIINLSDFTMNTAMTAMILYEQIYRGYRILNNHPYHK